MLQIRSFTFNPVQENSYVLYNEQGEACIIDPGCYFSAEEEALVTFLKAHALTPTLLLNTHCHLDHIFGNRFIQKTFGLPLHLHRLDKPVFDLGPQFGQQWGLPFDNFDGAFQYVEDGETITLGADKLQVLLTPGHSPGSVCFYCAAQGFVIGGDVLFNGSIGRTDLPLGDFKTLEHSIRTKLYTLPDSTLVYPGHGQPTTIGDEKRSNPFVKA